MKKKILSICLVAVIAVLAITGASLAYFTDNEQKVNTFTLGDVKIKLEESNWPTNDRFDVVPGVAYQKNPVVKNVGKNTAWIKVDVTLSDAKAFIKAVNNHFELAEFKLESIFTVDSEFDDKWKLVAQPELDEENDTLTYSYYYLNRLEKNQNTGSLFSEVTIPKQFNNADMKEIGPDFTITVTAHAIQDEPFENVDEAFLEYTIEPRT